MDELKVKTPAKINLGLSIINKREDGYHNIETLFYPVNLFDVIRFKKSDRLYFQTNNTLLKTETDNLVLKAIELLEKCTSRKFLVEIFLEKNIPIGAGLGGGSSDAAATLKAINELFSLDLTTPDLLKIALELGSDVPFFINAKPALAESRGEILTEIHFEIPYPLLLVNPGIHISTKWAFGRIKMSKINRSGIHKFANENYKVEEYKRLLFNDFEEVISSEFPQIQNIKEKFYSLGALFSLMSGSGSTVFGIFVNEESLKAAEKYFKDSGYSTFVHFP